MLTVCVAFILDDGALASDAMASFRKATELIPLWSKSRDDRLDDRPTAPAFGLATLSATMFTECVALILEDGALFSDAMAPSRSKSREDRLQDRPPGPSLGLTTLSATMLMVCVAFILDEGAFVSDNTASSTISGLSFVIPNLCDTAATLSMGFCAQGIQGWFEQFGCRK
jgi:hypothetical protein